MGAWTEAEVLQLQQLNAQGVSLPEVAKALGRNYSSVSTKAQKIGLRFRRHDRIAIDELSFRNITADVAWVIGLLFADGAWSRCRHTMQLTSTDPDLVLQTKRVLKCASPVVAFEPNRNGGSFGNNLQYRITINSVQLLTDLHSLGVQRLKSDRAAFPALPQEVYSHFIRGYFDGDGGISINKKGRANVYFAGPVAFAETLRTYLLEHVQIKPSSLYLPKQTKDIGTFQVLSQESQQRLYDYMYIGAAVYGYRKRSIWDRLYAFKTHGVGGELA